MDTEQLRRKRKRIGRLYSPGHYLSLRSLIACFTFFVFVLFLSFERFYIGSASFRPVLRASTKLSFLSSSRSSSVLDSFSKKSLPLRVEDRVVFPDHVLLMLESRINGSEDLQCVYYDFFSNSSEVLGVQPVLSADQYDAFRSIVRCPLPPANQSAAGVDLRRQQSSDAGKYDWSARGNQTAHWWENVVYEAVLDANTAIVFVKGLNLRLHKISDHTQLSCHFGFGNSGIDEGFEIQTEAVSAAQEVIRCLLPQSIRNNPAKAQGIRVTVGRANATADANADADADAESDADAEATSRSPLPSVAKISGYKSEAEKRNRGKYELCACTMLWNQAPAFREWIMYHAWLGVERWFIYDNNSDDGIEEVIQELGNYNISRHSWPWIKTQEAGFSHCALRAKYECKWLGFFDVDEFFYLSHEFRHSKAGGVPGRNSLKAMVANYSLPNIAEIRTICYSFGPSGLSKLPPHGVTVGYSCRMQRPERHKSIVRPDLLDFSLLNIVHHFQLREGFKNLNVPESIAVINHYKYQVWETFKAKFHRRVATYVVDWRQDQNKGSKDRAPGLGTEAIEPRNWRLRFCDVWDTRLSDFVWTYLADPATGLLPWDRPRQ